MGQTGFICALLELTCEEGDKIGCSQRLAPCSCVGGGGERTCPSGVAVRRQEEALALPEAR